MTRQRFPREIPPYCIPLPWGNCWGRYNRLYLYMQYIWGFRCNRETPTPIDFDVLEHFR